MFEAVRLPPRLPPTHDVKRDSSPLGLPEPTFLVGKILLPTTHVGEQE